MTKCKTGDHEIYKRGDAWAEDERKVAGTYAGGAERRAPATPPPPPTEQPAPRREHLMHRRIFGGKAAAK